MNIESIGTWAGEVYKALESSETRMLGLKQIKKATKLKKDELMAAFGWLGREGKITITTNDGFWLRHSLGETPYRFLNAREKWSWLG